MTNIGALSGSKVIILEKNAEVPQKQPKLILAESTDIVDLKKSEKENKPPKIGFFRLATGFITKKQIEQINKTGKLPDNAKFVPSAFGGYQITNDIFGITPGTKELPAGFEVKKGGLLGQAIVVAKGTEGLFIR